MRLPSFPSSAWEREAPKLRFVGRHLTAEATLAGSLVAKRSFGAVRSQGGPWERGKAAILAAFQSSPRGRKTRVAPAIRFLSLKNRNHDDNQARIAPRPQPR